MQDSYFDAFTQPIINKKVNDSKPFIIRFLDEVNDWLFTVDLCVCMVFQVEKKTCGDGPSLEEILEDDNNLQNIFLDIKVLKRNLKG